MREIILFIYSLCLYLRRPRSLLPLSGASLRRNARRITSLRCHYLTPAFPSDLYSSRCNYGEICEAKDETEMHSFET